MSLASLNFSFFISVYFCNIDLFCTHGFATIVVNETSTQLSVMTSHSSDVQHNTYVNLTDGNLTVLILPRSHARFIVLRKHGSVKSVYPLYLD